MTYKTDYYQILNLNYEATQTQIKASFRKLAKKYHPDLNPNTDYNQFVLINEAYEILSDKNLKEKYDQVFFRKNNNYFFNRDFENRVKQAFQENWDDFSNNQYYNPFKNHYSNPKTNYDYNVEKNFGDNLGVDQDFDELNSYEEAKLNEQFDRHSQGFNNYQENSFEILGNWVVIAHFEKAFQMKWDEVLAILSEAQLNKKQIYIRCFLGQHYFNFTNLSAKQLAAENFHKNVLIWTSEYKKFVKYYNKQKNNLDLTATFYVHVDLIETNFTKIIGFYRLYECSACQSSAIKNYNYCDVCLNKKYLKERAAISLAWKANQKLVTPLIYNYLGNRNDEFIGNLKVNVVYVKHKINPQKFDLVIHYGKKININEIIENKK